MPNKLRGFYKVGGVSLVASGILFLVHAVLDLLAGQPPSGGAETLAWALSRMRIFEAESEVLFFAAMFLVPAVVAIYRSLEATDRTKATIGCGIIAVVIPVLVVLDIFLGRLAWPVYGIRAETADLVQFVVAIYYGGMHAINECMAIATVILSLAMARGAYGKVVAYLGIATAVADVVGSFPWLIGPVPTLVCQVFFAGWFVAVGSKLCRMSEHSMTIHAPTS